MPRLLPLALACLASACTLAGCAVSGPQVPDKLKPPAGQEVSLVAYAQGVQIYECQAGAANPAQFAWTFKAPEATLADRAGRTIGKHYAGPTWELSDGSRIVGQVQQSDPGTDPNAIPWLLLSAKSSSGAFSRTQSIQRVQTVAGKAPAANCTAVQAGTQVRVTYQAVYYFYSQRG